MKIDDQYPNAVQIASPPPFLPPSSTLQARILTSHRDSHLVTLSISHNSRPYLVLSSKAGTLELPFEPASNSALFCYPRHTYLEPRILDEPQILHRHYFKIPSVRPRRTIRDESKYTLTESHSQSFTGLETLPRADRRHKAQEKRDQVLCSEERPQARDLLWME
jgi:hypothetical protein